MINIALAISQLPWWNRPEKEGMIFRVDINILQWFKHGHLMWDKEKNVVYPSQVVIYEIQVSNALLTTNEWSFDNLSGVTSEWVYGWILLYVALCICGTIMNIATEGNQHYALLLIFDPSTFANLGAQPKPKDSSRQACSKWEWYWRL